MTGRYKLGHTQGGWVLKMVAHAPLTATLEEPRPLKMHTTVVGMGQVGKIDKPMGDRPSGKCPRSCAHGIYECPLRGRQA